MKTSLEIAQLAWTEEGLPYSSSYGDLYFSKENGLAEKRHTFLDGNRIAERFSQLRPKEQFTILETGFGTGLNFLATFEAWGKNADPQANLDFISIEAHPLHQDDLERALSLWPELKDLAIPLVEGYPHLAPGFHPIQISPQVRLILIFAEVKDALEQIAGPIHPDLPSHLPSRIDACYLDGFAPRVNPDMWAAELFPLLAALSKENTTLTSFTSAGSVRSALQNSGFEVNRVAGYGHKLEMISAGFTVAPKDFWLAKPGRKRGLPTWSLSAQNKVPQSVTILGAGIAGATLADSLARQGVEVRLIDACDQAMQKASGNTQAALFARLSTDTGELEDFALTALEYASRYYRDAKRKDAFHPCGLIQLPRKDAELKTMLRVAERFKAAASLVQFLSSEELGELAGIPLPSAGLWMPKSGWVNPATLAQILLDHPLIETRFGTQISRIENEDSRWQLFDDRGNELHETAYLVVCAGHTTTQLNNLSWLPTRNIRGQVSLVQHSQLAPLRTIVCAHGYLAPESGGLHSLGATYDLDSDSETVLPKDHQQNLQVLAQLTGIAEAQTIDGRAGVRCATPDYLPICGPAPNVQQIKQDFAELAKDAKRHIAKPGTTLPGLYLNLGYGSRGFCYAPLGAELLASHIMGRPAPLPHYLTAALHPARFIIRDIIRNKH